MKMLGCCTLCNEEVYEILLRWTLPPYEREPRKVGKPLPTAYAIDYFLHDGSTMTLTVCDKCKDKAQSPETFPKLWDIVLEALSRELKPEYLAYIGSPPRDERQQTAVVEFVSGLEAGGILGVASVVKVDETLWGNNA